MARSRIKANRDKLTFTPSIGLPIFYYDKNGSCRDCGRGFVFTKEEQRVWYEKFGLHHYTEKIRCEVCQEKFHNEAMKRSEYEESVSSYREHENSAEACLELARNAIEIDDRNRIRKWDKIVAVLAKALKLEPRMVECHYWLGRCYQNMNLPKKARASYEVFVAKGSLRKGLSKSRIKDAQRRLTELEACK